MLTDEQKKVVSDMLDTIKLLEQQNKQLKEALEWYADIFTYKSVIGNHARISLDLGDRARAALQQIQGGK